jgi:hypothetical protein
MTDLIMKGIYMDWKFIMCLLVMCSTTVWKLLEILTYGEIQVRPVDDIMIMYMAFTIYAAYKAGMAVQAKKQKQTKEKIAIKSDNTKGE